MKEAQFGLHIIASYPALVQSEKWLHSLEIPAVDTCHINKKMMFGYDGIDDESLFKLVDKLQFGTKGAG